MLIIPAIDLKDHQVVRLSQGLMDQSKVYHEDPLIIASQWVTAGATRIHIVDLNGAFEGRPVHLAEIEKIARAFPDIKIEVGGGIRSMDTLRLYLDHGVHACILGTAALKDPNFFEEASSKFPGRLILGVDARDGIVAVEGWGELGSIRAIELVLGYQHLSIESVIYTDISKDGMLSGMNFLQIQEMAQASPFPVIASGGLTSLDDVEQLKKVPNILGVIAGKALYEERIDLKEAIQAGRNAC